MSGQLRDDTQHPPLGAGVGLGMAVGTALGVAFGSLAWGVSLGLGSGALLDVAIYRSGRRTEAARALEPLDLEPLDEA